MGSFGYKEASEDKVIRPQKPPRNASFDRWVTKDSSRWQRKHFVQLRRYQSLECRDGMIMDDSDLCWRHFEGYAFLEEYDDAGSGDLRYWLVGAAGFDRFSEGTILQFCWIHPFFRGRGLLRKAWPRFEERFGLFRVSQPRSSAMRGFLGSIEHPCS